MSALKVIIYSVAALALLIGFFVSGMADEEHEDEGFLEGDTAKVAGVVAVLTVVTVVSLVYLSRQPPRE